MTSMHPSHQELDDLQKSQGNMHIDTKLDEAPTQTWTDEEEKKTVRKLDCYLIAMLGSLYLVSYIDRGNIGNARTAGMGESWNMDSDQYAWLVTIYYVAYISFHWTILMWKIVTLPIWVMCAALGWGFMSMIQAACHSYGAMMAARFLIGVFEAAFAPGVALFLSMFYHRHEMGLRYGLFISFSPLASCFASALAYGILQADTALMGWQLLFIVEGSPTIILAVIAAFILPNAPGQCRFLNKEENHIVAMRALKGRGADQEKKLNLKQVFSAFYDYKNYLQAAIIFCLNCAFGSLPAYMPTIIAEMGIGTKLEAQGLSAPPYLLAYFVCLAASFLSDKAQNRGFFILGFCCTGGVGYILLGVVHTTAVRYFATFLVCAGTFPAVALTFTWVTDNQGSASKRGAGLAIFGMVGQCGSILGARIFPTQEGPYYIKGMTICAAVLFFGAVLSQVLSFSLRMQNRSRDKKHGKGDVGSMPEDISDLGDDHPMYRYVL